MQSPIRCCAAKPLLARQSTKSLAESSLLSADICLQWRRNDRPNREPRTGDKLGMVVQLSFLRYKRCPASRSVPSRRFLHCYSQGDGVNKAPSVACGNFAIDTTCGYLTMPEKPTEVRKLETPNFVQWRICKWVANEG